MVGGARAAKTASCTEDSSVCKEKSYRVVVAGNRNRGDLVEIAGVNVVDFRGQLGRIIRERLTVDLTSNDHDIAIGHNHTAGEDTLIPHRVDGLHSHIAARTCKGDDVGVGGGVDVLVAGGTARHQNLPCHGIVHGSNTTHGITVVVSVSYTRNIPIAERVVPVHLLGWAGLEDVLVLPCEQHTMVVSPVDALRVLGEHVRNRTAGQLVPHIPGWVVDLGVFSSGPTRPRPANDESATSRSGGLSLIASLNVHVGEASPLITSWDVCASLLGSVPTSGDNAALGIQAQTLAEHVVLHVGDGALADGLRAWVVVGGEGGGAVGATIGTSGV